jgi:hypothetical protein
MAQPILWLGYIKNPGDPSDAENRQAWMKAYFASVVPDWDATKFDQVRESCLEEVCKRIFDRCGHPTRAYFDTYVDRLTWEKCHSTFLRVTPAPEWPWSLTVPNDDYKVVGMSPVFKAWAISHVAEMKKNKATSEEQNESTKGKASSASKTGGSSPDPGSTEDCSSVLI